MKKSELKQLIKEVIKEEQKKIMGQNFMSKVEKMSKILISKLSKYE